MKKQKGRSSQHKSNKVLIPVILVLTVIGIALLCMIGYTLRGGAQPDEPSENPVPPPVTDAATLPPVTQTTPPPETMPPDDRLPYLLEDDKLEIESLFQYTGLNPDNYWEEGRNIGAVVLINRSEEYLEFLDMTITMSDGVQLHFLIQDIPAGKTVWAYETENTSFDDNAVIVDVQYEAAFMKGEESISTHVSFSVEGVNITLTNLSGTELTGLEVRCHGVIEGVYFGGTSYTYPVETLAAGTNTMVTALEWLLGEAAVATVKQA